MAVSSCSQRPNSEYIGIEKGQEVIPGNIWAEVVDIDSTAMDHTDTIATEMDRMLFAHESNARILTLREDQGQSISEVLNLTRLLKSPLV